MSDLVVQIARSWIGTPYVHQASTKGAGCDCLGLLRGIWRHLYHSEPESVPPYSMDWSEAARQERLWDAAQRHLIAEPAGSMRVGQVLLFRMRDGGVAKHLGIAGTVGDESSFIHAYSRHGVVESPLSMPWKRRIVAQFSFPEGSK